MRYFTLLWGKNTTSTEVSGFEFRKSDRDGPNATASECMIFAESILIAANHKATELGERGIAIAVIIVITCIHTFTPGFGVRIMNVLGLIKIIIFLFIVITRWVVLGGNVHKVPDPGASFRNSFAGSSSSGYENATALFKVLNSYSG